MSRKLRDSRGETLVETLAAILIASLSVALLFTCVMASVRIDENARAADGRYYDALSEAEKQETPATAIADSGTAKVEGNGSNSQTIPITFYGGEDMYSYKEGVSPSGP